MSSAYVFHLRWVSIDGHDRLRWQAQGTIKPGDKYRLYAADARGTPIASQQPLLEMAAPPWQVDIEVKPEWYEKWLTIRIYEAEAGKEQTDSSHPGAIFVPKPDSVCRLGSTEMPSWLAKLDPKKRAVITQSDYYKNWLETSTDRCTDLSRLESDNASHLPLKWRTDSRILFHGDEEQRSPDEIFKTGLTPPEPWGTLKMRLGSHVGGLESFSYSFMVTTGFDAEATILGIPESKLGYIYLTDAPGGLLVDESLGNEVNNGEQEVAFPGGVQSCWIIGAFVMNGHGLNEEFKTYQPNPHYQGKLAQSVPGMTRIMVSCWDPAVHISLHTDGKSELSTLDSHGIGFVEIGKVFKIALHHANEAKVSAEWRINQVDYDGDVFNYNEDHRYSEISIANPQPITDTQTIIIEAMYPKKE